MFSIWADHYFYCDKQKVLEEIEQFSLIRPHPLVGVIHDLQVHYRAHDSQKTKKQLGICYQILGSHRVARYGGYLKSGGDLIAFPHLFKTTPSRWLKTLLTVCVDNVSSVIVTWSDDLMAGAAPLWRSHVRIIFSHHEVILWFPFCDGGVNNLCSGPGAPVMILTRGLIMKHFALRWQSKLIFCFSAGDISLHRSEHLYRTERYAYC